MTSKGVADEAPGHLRRCKRECRSVWRSVDAYQRTSLTGGWKLLEQGPESQAASAICSGGVSAVMGSSDLDGPTFGSRGASGNRLSCSLLSRANRSIVGPAC